MNFTNEIDDSQLMLAVITGNQNAFEFLVKRYSKYFYHAAYRITLSKEEAEDIVQEAFLKLLDGRAKWKEGKGALFKTWFYRIVLNQALDRGRKKINFDTEMDSSIIDQKELQDRVVEKREESELIHLALQSLNYKQRMSIELCYYSDLSQQEASKLMGLNIKGYESLLLRAKDRLKKELANYER